MYFSFTCFTFFQAQSHQILQCLLFSNLHSINSLISFLKCITPDIAIHFNSIILYQFSIFFIFSYFIIQFYYISLHAHALQILFHIYSFYLFNKIMFSEWNKIVHLAGESSSSVQFLLSFFTMNVYVPSNPIYVFRGCVPHSDVVYHKCIGFINFIICYYLLYFCC